MSYPVSGLGKPQGGGAFPLWEDVDFLGGYQVQATTAARDAIPVLNQKVGMLCYVIETVTTYRLSATGTPGTWAALPTAFTPGGDLGGNSSTQSVLKINGIAVSGTPSTGYMLIATGSTAATWQAAPAGFVAGGDLTGTATSQTVAKINGIAVSGTPATGYVLTATGTAAATWQTAPTGFTAGGDLTGTSTSQTVAKVNGVTITGTPAAGYIPIASSSTAAAWGAAPSGFTAGGDLTGSSTSQTVVKINGVAANTAIDARITANIPTGTGFAHITAGVRDAAAKLVDLAADVTGLLPTTGINGFSTAVDARITANIPTGTGFSHITSGARDAAARAVNLASSADVSGILGPANGGPSYQGSVSTTAGASTTVKTWTMSTESMLDLTADICLRAPSFAFFGRLDVTAAFWSDGTTITTLAPSAVSNPATTGLSYTPPLAAFVVSGNTVSLIVYGPTGRTHTWFINVFENGG